jgi:membrane-associated phospholipid phosphatase
LLLRSFVVTRQALAWATLVVVAARTVSLAAEDPQQGTTTTPAPASSPAHPIERIAERTRELPPTRWTLEVETPLRFVERVLWDTAYLSTAPARWDAPDWGRFTLFAAATGGAFGADHTIDIESRIHHPRSTSEKNFEDAVEELGSLPGIAGVVGGAAILGFAFDSDLAKSISADAGEAVLVSGLFAEIGKQTTGRHRPRDGEGPFSFHPFSGDASLPSGHTTTAFALASAVSEDLGNDPWIAVPAYALAALVGFARTRANAHFASDIVLGGTIGAATGRTVAYLEQERIAREHRKSLPAVSIMPRVSPRFAGLELRVGF